MNHIYLDNNATTQIHPAVAERMAECLRAGHVNPASQHQAGRRTRRVLEEARERIARLLGADVDSFAADRLVFTSGGTEANNLAIFGLVHRQAEQVVVSSLEHSSVSEAADQLAARGTPVSRIRARVDGTIDIQHLEDLLATPTQLVSVMAANNETGVIQPIDDVARLCRQAGVPLHVDAVQVAGKLPIDFQASGAAAMTISAHKFHGPRGIGGLLLRHDATVQPVLFGGFQQDGLRPGTESVELCVGMQAALEIWHDESAQRLERMTRLRHQLETNLHAAISGLVILGFDSPRLPHTVNLALPGLDRQAVVMALDLAGVACSTGSACASGSSELSPTLLAMGLAEDIIRGAIRLSLSALTTESEVAESSHRIIRVFNDLQQQASSRKSRPAARHDHAKTL